MNIFVKKIYRRSALNTTRDLGLFTKTTVMPYGIL